MKRTFIILFSTILVSGFTSCKKFAEFQVDPNRPTQANPELLLPTIERLAFNEVSTGAALASRQLAYTDGVSSDQYYGWQRGSFSNYSNLLQVVRMEKEAKRTNKPVYLGLAKFFHAYFGMRLTLAFGDVPFSEALKGDEGKYTSVYDPQEQIFLRSLDGLKEANSILQQSKESIQGDIIYNGNLLKWRKLINTFSLRILMSLSLKDGNSTLNVKQRFADIVNNPGLYPVFTGNQDNAQLVFQDIQDNRYPYYNDNSMQTAYYLEESFVDTLQKMRDPRLFSFASKAPKYASLPVNDFNAYGGIKGSAPFNENTKRVVAGEASKINPRFYTDPVNEPSIAVSYSELQFLLAEASVRGWISGNTNQYYTEGIRASMQFYNISSTDINTYLAYPEVILQQGNEISSILVQKYIGSFMNAGWNSFFEQRRTGFPVFDVSGSGILNNARIPKRWMYPEVELQLNKEQVNEAIKRQFTAGENVNELMWILK